MPTEWHFDNNSDRIPSIYVVPDEGWAITSRKQWESMNGTFSPAGNHGYSNHYASMHAIFIAHGPFASRIKSNPTSNGVEEDGITVIPGFDNLEIYNLVTRLLGVGRTARNNGTVGFWDRYLD